MPISVADRELECNRDQMAESGSVEMPIEEVVVVGRRAPSPEQTVSSLGAVRVQEVAIVVVEVGPGFVAREDGAHLLWKVLLPRRRHHYPFVPLT